MVFLKKGRLYVHCVKYGGEKTDSIQTTFEEAFERISCAQDEKALSLSGGFWDAYEAVKKFKEYKLPPSELSLEQNALNNLKMLIEKVSFDELLPYKDFLRIMREDILEYGTLSDYTLRRIGNLECGDKSKEKRAVLEIKSLMSELGEDYLEKEKAKQKNLSKEVIIAIENQKA